MNGDWLAIVIGAGTLAAVALGTARVRRRRNDHLALKSQVLKWEDEGGNVPQVPTVSPVVTPTASVPPGR